MIDVLKRLAELDESNPNRPEYQTKSKSIVESMSVEGCGMMGSMDRPTIPATINMSAGSGEELGDLIRAIASISGASKNDVSSTTLSATPSIGIASIDGEGMRSMLDALNPMDDIDNNEEQKAEETYDNTPADPNDSNAFDSEEFAHHENPPGAASGRGNMNNPRAVPTMEQIKQNLFAEYQRFISEN